MATRQHTTTANKLDYLWISPAQALLPKHAVLLERLRLGYGLLDQLSFRRAIRSQAMHILAIRNNCAALIAFGECEDGAALNILTLAGTLEGWKDALPIVEKAARASNVNVVMSVCELGWKRVALANGYQVRHKLFVRKVLHDERSEGVGCH